MSTDPGKWPQDYRVTLAVVVAAILALGWVEARMSRVAAQEVAPVKEQMESITKRDRKIIEKLDALCRATPTANCPLGVE